MCEDGDIIEKPFEIVNSIKITAGCRGANMEQLTFYGSFHFICFRERLFLCVYTLDKTWQMLLTRH